ncbi:MAG: hypothetical protein HW387_882 [Parachlamydiales bacterium]|nr:hypothetical protein [Parachlamydiales bacterium]
MAKNDQYAQFIRDKKDTTENLEAIQMILTECVNEGMMDEDAHFYNEVLELIDEVHLIKTYPELAEVVDHAKTLESDIDAWLSMKQRETLSISWPQIPKQSNQ